MYSSFIQFVRVTSIFFICWTVAAAQVPVVSAISPSETFVNERISITGTDLGSILGVSFGNTEADINSILNSTSTEFSILVPNVGLGSVDVVVTTPGGISNLFVFTVISAPITAPTITGVSSLDVEVDDIITISGINLISITSISFGSIQADTSSLIYHDSQTISIKVPLVNNTGSYPISIIASAGNSDDFPFTISGLNIPKITVIEPTISLSDLYVTISGYNFTSITGIIFGNTLADLATFSAINDTSFSIKLPSLAVGSQAVYIETIRGTSLPFDFKIGFPGPTILSIVPTELAVGEKISITGTNFTANSYVTFNVVTTSGIRLISSTIIEAIAPNGLATGIVTVTTPYGTASGVNTITVNENLGIRGTFTGIAYLDKNSYLDIYPNPANNYMYVNALNQGQIEFYDFTGQLVLSAYTNIKIDLNAVKNGMYLLRIKDNTNTLITRKIVVQKSPE